MHLGDHQIEHNEIVLGCLAHQEGFVAVVTDVHGEPRTVAKRGGDVIGQSDFVFDNKDAQ